MAGLGEILQNTRLMRGVSLEEAERATHISRRYLEALESEDFSVFVAPVFARGFLRNYSQYLGLDPIEMLQLWPETGGPAPPDREPETSRTEFERRARPLRERTAPRQAPVVRSGEPPSPLSRPTLAPADSTPVRRALVLLAGLLIGLAVVALVAARLAGGKTAASPVPGAAAPTATRAQAPAPGQPKPSPSPAARNAGAMPNLVGKDGGTAVQQLQQTGVTPLVISVTSPRRTDRPGTVIRQTPAAGTRLSTNSSVTLVVNQGAVVTPAPAPAASPGSRPPGSPATRPPTPASR